MGIQGRCRKTLSEPGTLLAVAWTQQRQHVHCIEGQHRHQNLMDGGFRELLIPLVTIRARGIWRRWHGAIDIKAS